MKKYLSILLALTLLMLVFSSCKKTDIISEPFDVKTGDTFTVKVSMEDSGLIKSMALTVYSDDDAFEIVDGKWLSQQAVIADFNKENKDAAIAFKEDTDYCGEIFEFTVKAKKDLTVVNEMFDVDAVLKNEQKTLSCKGITLSFVK
ncbi:MAG: hypothetical protein IJZ16_11110 [Clostridia bacterium]|nr:hypothetical protein [Clostridia bacterium]